ncbi:MAG: site-2 protease family protein [Acidobacteria bacterium]|nr:site-2 protease family protein [Acidobacteriota bacterium]
MSIEDHSLLPGLPEPTNGGGLRARAFVSRLVRRRPWLHGLLLAATLLTTTAMGARMWENFHHNRPAFQLERDWAAMAQVWKDPAWLMGGLPFSLCLLGILLAHELGHYLTCRFYGLDASLPFFLPAPTFIGTFGAFIRIRSPIFTRRVLFDVGIAGPMAGFALLLPVLGIGLACSKVIPGIAQRGDLVFGTPLMLWLVEQAVFPGVPASDIYLHPVARAAWVGLFATALNLLPIGQLDGGHILYSFVGERHRLLSRLFAVALIPIGIFFWYGWLFWAGVLLFFGMRHPAIHDPGAMDRSRRALGWVALAMFLLSFTLSPIQPGHEL